MPPDPWRGLANQDVLDPLHDSLLSHELFVLTLAQPLSPSRLEVCFDWLHELRFCATISTR